MQKTFQWFIDFYFWKMIPLLPGLLFIIFLFLNHFSQSQIIFIQEAERYTIKAAAPQKIINESKWASSGKGTNWWGTKKDDSISWKWTAKSTLKDAQMALRYAYNEADMTRREGPQDKKRELVMTIDDTTRLIFNVPDTGGWSDFETAYVNLPKLNIGLHTFVLTTPVDKILVDVDCFTVFQGSASYYLQLPFRNTIVARQSYPKIWIKMTPLCKVKWTPDQILRDFTKIYTWFKEFTGWEPDRPLVVVHVYEDKYKVGTFENGDGVHFEAENFNWDKGNWVHEMNHVWHNGYFPPLLEHPLIRTNDAFDASDGIFPDRDRPPGETFTSHLHQRALIAAKVLDNPNYKTDDFKEILFALRVKYGPKLITGFYHQLLEGKKRGEIPLKRNGPMYKNDILKYMSQAAGEEISPFFQRWNGWENEN